jgi:hypothetical protein
MIKSKHRKMIALLTTGLAANLASAGPCDWSCQALGVGNAVACKAAIGAVGGYVTVAYPAAGVIVGMAIDDAVSLCDDWGVSVYEDCYDLFCAC